MTLGRRYIIIIVEGMKLRRNRRLANFTKSAVTIWIWLPRVPLHYRCLPYTLVVPFLALTLQRSAFIRTPWSSEVGFFDIFQKWDKSTCHKNYANEPCLPHLLTYRSSKRQHISCSRHGKWSHTIHRSFTTLDVYVFAYCQINEKISTTWPNKNTQATMTFALRRHLFLDCNYGRTRFHRQEPDCRLGTYCYFCERSDIHNVFVCYSQEETHYDYKSKWHKSLPTLFGYV